MVIRKARCLVVLAYGAWLGLLTATGMHKSYVHPRLTPFVAASGVFLLILGVYGLSRNGRRGSEDHGEPGGYTALFIAALPLLMALIPPSATVVKGKGGQSTPAPATGTAREIQKSASDVYHVKDYDFAAIASLVWSDPNAFGGQRLGVTGFVSHVGGDGSFTVSRNLMTCCAADAIPVGFECRPRTPMPAPPMGEWITVVGVPTHPDKGVNGGGYLRILSVIAADAPEEPFIYADPGQ